MTPKTKRFRSAAKKHIFLSRIDHVEAPVDDVQAALLDVLEAGLFGEFPQPFGHSVPGAADHPGKVAVRVADQQLVGTPDFLVQHSMTQSKILKLRACNTHGNRRFVHNDDAVEVDDVVQPASQGHDRSIAEPLPHRVLQDDVRAGMDNPSSP